MVNYPCLGLKSKRDRRRVEIEKRQPLTKVQTKKDQKQYLVVYRAEHVATLSYYHSYDPRVVTLREDPAVLHAHGELICPARVQQQTRPQRILLTATTLRRRRAGCSCGGLD